ncbi:MAG: hypothetical protein Q9227_001551 [Pyrenula ochraceoflavens]
MVPPAGIIITVSVLVAAGIAAYENPQVREWIENSRRKIAVALHSLGDDIHPDSKRSRRNDPSMQEDQSEEASEKRRQARAEILNRGRILEEKKRRSQRSFDTLVDKDGVLLTDQKEITPNASTTAVDNQSTDGLTRRHAEPQPTTEHRDPSPCRPPPDLLTQLETSMREQFSRSPTLSSSASHASESLINLTPTSEFPDPDISLPSTSAQHTPSSSGQPAHLASTSYFPPPSATLSPAESPSFYYAHPSNPFSDLHATPEHQQQQQTAPYNQTPFEPPSSAPSTIASSDMEHILHAQLTESEDDGMSLLSDEEEEGDGIRTPASVWTEVDSQVSSEAGQGRG